MSHEKEHFIKLLEKYMHDEASVEEEELLFSMIRKGHYTQFMDQHILNSLQKKTVEGAGLPAEKAQDIIRSILADAPKTKTLPRKRISYRNWAAAAAVLLLFATGLYFFLDSFSKIEFNQSAQLNPDSDRDRKERYKYDVPPGGNKAILTLADGSSIVLDSVQRGNIAQQGSTKIIKLDNGKLVYRDSVSMLGSQQIQTNLPNLLYKEEPLHQINTLTTPRGGQHQLTLPDGTKVWLNAASSITFPTAFMKKERRVEIKGEAYFEVAKNTEMPFIVKINNKAEVKVLGTHFNINAYDDESSIKTTLLEGSVRMSSLITGQGSLLTPGEQASLDEKNKLKVEKVEMNETIAWKNGLISCKDADIQSIMRQIARWYDVEVVYEKNIRERIFTGEISRNTNLSEVLKILELSDIRFRIENKSAQGQEESTDKVGKKIIVMK